MNKKYDSINEKFLKEPDEHLKKVAVLIKQIKEYEDAFESLTADNEILKETNGNLQERSSIRIAECLIIVFTASLFVKIIRF